MVYLISLLTSFCLVHEMFLMMAIKNCERSYCKKCGQIFENRIVLTVVR